MNKINHLIITTGLVLLSSSFLAQPSFSWVNTMGSTGNDFGDNITVDALGNVYTVGRFTNTVDFDPGIGTSNLTSFGNYDVFIQKLDNAGNLIWAKQIGGTSADGATSISIDGNGDLVISGHFRGTADFDPGIGTTNLTATGSYNDAYVLKLDNNGNLIWVKQIDATHHCFTVDAGINSVNDILLTGRWYGTADFDPGIGTHNLTATGTGWDIFVLKLTSSGNFVWVSPVTGSENNYNQALAVDLNDNVLISGYYYDVIDLDPGPGTVNYTAAPNQEDMFLLKLDNNGAYVWGQNYATAMATEITEDIYVDANNNYYFGGWFSSPLDFDLGPGDATLTPNGSGDCFLLKLNAAGTFQWVNHMGGPNTDEIHCVTSDKNGDILVAGFFDGTVDFDPGPAVDNRTSTGISNTFFQKIDTSGSYFWAATMEGIVSDLTSYTNGDILSTGRFAAVSDFDPGIGVVNATPVGSNDIFVHKLNECAVMTGTDVLTVCDSVLWLNGNTYYSNNTTATHTLVNGAHNGCDSVITLNLTVNNTATSVDVQTACNSYTWIDNNTYTSSNNTATHTITNGAASGCDSIITLNLTINTTATGTDVVTACNSYTWIDNNTYTTNNTTATHTLVNGAANGCDSIVTLNLTINTVDNTTSTQGVDSISANASGATYQWLDCDNNYAIINGETNQLFVASSNGNFAVQVTQNGCTDTSACVNITSVGIHENSFGDSFTVYPNPSSGNITITWGGSTYNNLRLDVINVVGEVVDHRVYNSTSKIVYDPTKKLGVYFFHIQTDQGNIIRKVVFQ